MHQGHTIPWSTFEKHFTFVVEDRRYTPPFTGFLHKNSTAAVKELQHFVRKFTATITEFSETERKKYSARIPLISIDNKVFSDALRDRYPVYLTEGVQSLSSWLDPVKHHPYGFGALRGVVMVLLFENEMETLLMLAQHPKIQMAQILKSGPSEHYQPPHGEETALWAYLLFNTMEAVGQLSNGNYAQTADYKFLMDSIRRGVGKYHGQQVAHEMLLPGRDTRGAGIPYEYVVHTRLEELHAYVKNLFALMYRYDVLAREVGVDPRWERQIKDNIIYQYGLPRQFGIDEHNTPVLITLDA